MRYFSAKSSVRLAQQVLKPVPLAIVFFAIALLVQFMFLSSRTSTISLTGSSHSRTVYSFGLGSPFRIISEEDRTNVSIRWATLLLNLTATYMLAAIAATGAIKAARLRRPATAYALIALGMVAIALIASIGISKAEWGYFFMRPGLLSEVNEIVRVRAIVPVKTEIDDSGKRTLVTDKDYSLLDRIASGKKDSYYCLDARVLIELERRSLLPVAPGVALDQMSDLYSLIQGSGMLSESSQGYDSSSGLKGVVVDAVDKLGDRLLFLGLTGGQLSNDHYPYYEMIFRGQTEGPAISFVRGQRFFYDVAGMEGLEWYLIWPMLALLGIAGAFIIFTAVSFIWKRSWSISSV